MSASTTSTPIQDTLKYCHYNQIVSSKYDRHPGIVASSLDMSLDGSPDRKQRIGTTEKRLDELFIVDNHNMKTPDSKTCRRTFSNTNDSSMNLERSYRYAELASTSNCSKSTGSALPSIDDEMQHLTMLERASTSTKQYPWQPVLSSPFSIRSGSTTRTHNVGRDDGDCIKNITLSSSSAFYSIHESRCGKEDTSSDSRHGISIMTPSHGNRKRLFGHDDRILAAPLLPTSPELSIPGICRFPPPMFSPLAATTGKAFTMRVPLRVRGGNRLGVCNYDAAMRSSQTEQQSSSSGQGKSDTLNGIEYIDIGSIPPPVLPSVDSPDADALRYATAERRALKIRRTQVMRTGSQDVSDFHRLPFL